MPTDPQRLRATLDELHRQLAEISDPDPAVKDQLIAALLEIQAALKGHAPAGEKSLMRRLGEAARHFEESHPALSGTISSLIDTLGRSGI